MGLLGTAVGAVVAAILEVSVLAQLQLAGIRPDLVLAVGIGVAMTMGFDAAIVWAFVGGLLLDVMLPERPIGSTTLAMLISVGVALVVARVVESPRLLIIGATAFGITFLYEALLAGILSLASGIETGALSLASWAMVALASGAIAVLAAWVIRSLVLRFGTFERVDW
ncbi:MAG: rod shape-determining protein MreD [Candidatus Limnocylindrales bacterium]